MNWRVTRVLVFSQDPRPVRDCQKGTYSDTSTLKISFHWIPSPVLVVSSSFLLPPFEVSCHTLTTRVSVKVHLLYLSLFWCFLDPTVFILFLIPNVFHPVVTFSFSYSPSLVTSDGVLVKKSILTWNLVSILFFENPLRLLKMYFVFPVWTLFSNISNLFNLLYHRSLLN